MFFISPPFGNYIQLPHTTSIYGSFTLEPRPGLWSQICKTLRYSFQYNAWVNQIGLRNKGIDWALKHVPNNHIISVAIMHPHEIKPLSQKIPCTTNIELNISCPNVQKSYKDLEQLKTFLSNKRKWCIIKVSPLCTFSQIDMYYQQGFRQFHCSNTYPTPYGGMSGTILQKYNEHIIQYIRQKYPDTEIIGGGGIQTWNHVLLYSSWGANHFAVSTACFRPFKFMSLYYSYRKYLL
jgi:dihydroorotate dehydrogenase